MNSNVLIGIDAGGSSTKAAAYTTDGACIARSQAGACNLSVDPDGAPSVLANALHALLQQLDSLIPEAELPLVCVGAAGAARNPAPLRQAILQLLGSRAREICIMTDAELALYAAHGTADGILIVSGTGSIGYRRCGNTLLRAGGWGHLLGDEGSGYDIAIRAIRAVLQANDTGATESVRLLQSALLSQLALNEPNELISYVYHHSKAEIAALATSVMQSADRGDTLAKEILQQAGEALGALCATLLSRAPATTPIPVAVSGSILTRCNEVRLSFEQTLRQRAMPVSCICALDEPTRGVLALYFSQA